MSATGWTFVSNHFLVLLCIAEDPGVRMAEIAKRIGITERAVQRIVADLAEAGYLTRTRIGRRNHYEINGEMPLRHLETQHRRVRELLLLLAKDSTPSSARAPGRWRMGSPAPRTPPSFALPMSAPPQRGFRGTTGAGPD